MEPRVKIIDNHMSLSNQVCLNCKSRKRKCSKRKPSCDLCRKLLLKCVYGSPPAEPDIGLRNGGAQENARISISPNGSFSDWQSSANFLAIFARQHYESTSPPSLELHDQTMKEVLRILVANGATLPTVFSEYFRTIGVWLPAIVFERSLYKRLQGEPSTEVALLILSMFLAMQVPDPRHRSTTFPQTSTYFAAKSLHSALLGAGAASLEVVQASVLILMYEAGQGMIDQARISAAFCSRIGVQVLSKRQYQHTQIVDDMDDEKLWWSIMMLDRFVNLGLPIHEVSFAPNQFAGRNGGLILSPCKDDIKLPPSPRSLPEFETFSRCASFGRAIDLLGQAFDYTKTLHCGGHLDQDDFRTLDEQLQSLLGQILRNSTHSWEESCESIGLIFSALFSMHKARYDLLENGTRDSANDAQKQLALLAIQSIINMLLDISVDFNDRLAYVDLPALPLPSTFAVYQAAMLHITFSGDRFGTEKWNAEIQSFKTSLAGFGMRWNIAKQYIEHIDNTMREEIRLRSQN